VARCIRGGRRGFHFPRSEYLFLGFDGTLRDARADGGSRGCSEREAFDQPIRDGRRINGWRATIPVSGHGGPINKLHHERGGPPVPSVRGITPPVEKKLYASRLCGSSRFAERSHDFVM